MNTAAQSTDSFPRIARHIVSYATWAAEAHPQDDWARMANASLAAEAAAATLDLAVQQAREAGRTWEEIAAATNMKSRQAAQQRWGKKTS